MKLYVCNEQNKWTKICNYDAVDYLEKMVEKIINKLLGNMNKIYSEFYPGFNDPNHPKKEEYQNIKCSNIMMLRDSDTHTKKIVDKIKDAFRINDEQEFEN